MLVWFVQEEGQDIIEYALLAAAISVVAIPTVPAIGTAVNNAYEDVKTKVSTMPGARHKNRADVPGRAGDVCASVMIRTASETGRQRQAGRTSSSMPCSLAAIGLSGIAAWPLIVAALRVSYVTLDTQTQNLWVPPDPAGGGS